MRHQKKHLTVKCHHLAAWQKYGPDCLGEEIVVRHKNDDPLDFRLENIELGTREDNLNDRYVNGMIQEWISITNNMAEGSPF